MELRAIRNRHLARKGPHHVLTVKFNTKFVGCHFFQMIELRYPTITIAKILWTLIDRSRNLSLQRCAQKRRAR